VGLPVARATEMSQKLNDIMIHARDIQRYRRKRAEGVTQIASGEVVNRIAEFLATQCGLSLDPTQKQNFETAIAHRIGGFIRREEFEGQMGLPTAEKGVGINKKQTFDTVRLIEKLIALGIPRSGEAHH
jgi:hypothetical protein